MSTTRREVQEVFDALNTAARDPALPRPSSDSEDEFAGLIYETLDDETDNFKLRPFSDGRWNDRDYPRSLSSLTGVSREWREIAIKFLFRVRCLPRHALSLSLMVSLADITLHSRGSRK